jgi:hypothetical protein
MLLLLQERMLLLLLVAAEVGALVLRVSFLLRLLRGQVQQVQGMPSVLLSLHLYGLSGMLPWLFVL